MTYFEKGRDYPNILISQGSGEHAYIFAELAHLIDLQGYNVFVMPKHGGHTINELVTRHADALMHLSTVSNSQIDVFVEGLGCYAAFYLTAAGGDPMNSLACLNGPAVNCFILLAHPHQSFGDMPIKANRWAQGCGLDSIPTTTQ